MKKLLVLFIICCTFCFTGCTQKHEITISEHDPIIIANTDSQDDTANNESSQSEIIVELPTGIQIENTQLADNFKLVCEQVGINPDEIIDMQPAGNWNGGPAYSFKYQDLMLIAQGNTDNTVEAIHVNGLIPIFDKRVGAYHINEYFVDDVVLPKVEAIAETVIKENFSIEDNTEIPLVDWQIDRNSNVYYVAGSIMVSKEEIQTFLLGIEVSENVKAPTLRYIMIGEEVLLDEFLQVKEPERKDPVEQTATILYSESSGFLLSEGDVNPYGSLIQDNENQTHINYYVPAGKYMVTSKTPICVLWITEYKEAITEDMLFNGEIMKMVEVPATGEPVEVIVSKGEHIMLSYRAKVVFEPIS